MFNVSLDYDPAYARLVERGERVDFLSERGVVIATFRYENDAREYATTRGSPGITEASVTRIPAEPADASRAPDGRR